jgi:hypothetical protein
LGLFGGALAACPQEMARLVQHARQLLATRALLFVYAGSTGGCQSTFGPRTERCRCCALLLQLLLQLLLLFVLV